MGLIMVNALMQGIKDYTDRDDQTPTNQFIKKSDPYFNVFIYLEFMLKVIGMGFSGSNSYMSDSWNWLDLFVVLSSLANDIMSFVM